MHVQVVPMHTVILYLQVAGGRGIQSILALTKEITDFYYVGLCSTVQISTVSDHSITVSVLSGRRLAHRHRTRPGLTKQYV